jgi:hypothetical protein
VQVVCLSVGAQRHVEVCPAVVQGLPQIRSVGEVAVVPASGAVLLAPVPVFPPVPGAPASPTDFRPGSEGGSDVDVPQPTHNSSPASNPIERMTLEVSASARGENKLGTRRAALRDRSDLTGPGGAERRTHIREPKRKKGPGFRQDESLPRSPHPRPKYRSGPRAITKTSSLDPRQMIDKCRAS